VKVVIDTNVFLSGIFWAGPAGDVLELWANDRIELVASAAILEEYERVLAEMERKEPDRADFWRLFIAQYSTTIDPPARFLVCRDPKDNMFLDCAVAAGAKCLVSGDKDLRVLKKVAGVEILTPREFLDHFFPLPG
jgi:putative PIN family toxin of toxin-antitoxin system